METFKFILLTVAVCVQVTSQESTGDSPTQIPKATITHSPTHKVLYSTETVTLHCEVPGGASEFQYDWYKDSTDLKTDHQSKITVKDSGNYECKAKNGTSESEKSDGYTLTLQAIPTPTLTKPMWTDVYTTENVSLKCEIQGSIENWTYRWFKKMNEVQESKSQLDIQSAKKDDSGNYTCQGFLQGRVETTMSNSVTIKVQEPPQPELSVESEWKTFYPTEKVTLKCSIDGGSNEWGYEWFRNGAQLSDDEDITISGNTLSISSAKASHSGQYTCRGKHLKRTPVTTRPTEALKLHIYDNTSKPNITKHQWFEFFYTEEEVQLGCNMPGDGWKYDWNKASETLITDPTFIISSASLSDTGVYHCKAKRGDFSVDSETLQVRVEARPPAVLSLETELSDIISGNILTLRCNVSDGRQWSYAWFENGQKLNGLSDMFKVTATEETIKSEFKCNGIRTERPLYSALSEGFTANNIILKRKILLAISGCLVCCIIILIIGCLFLRFTRKPEKKETVQEDLFFSMADSKNQTASPLEEYMGNSPTEMEECEEKEELLTDRVSAIHEDGVIKDEDSPAAEANGLTSFKGL